MVITFINKTYTFLLSSIVRYRAVITSTKPLNVRYIDYGNINSEEIKQVKYLPSDIVNFPAQAVSVQWAKGKSEVVVENMEITIKVESKVVLIK